jgi:NADPH:quinone reductase-like Zn-dependent oxidoreductase
VIGVEEFRQSSPLVSRDMWQSLLTESGFSGLDAVIGNSDDEDEHYCSTMVSTAAVDSEDKYPPTDIVLYGMRDAHGFRTLADALRASNASEPLLTELADIVAEEKIYIVLVHEKSLHQPSAEIYAKIQDLLTTARGILWVSQEDSTTLAAAKANLIIGLARTLRNENPLMRFATLSLDVNSDELDTASCDNIIRVWKACFSSKAAIAGVDLEYRERNGMVEIPRMVNEPQINAGIASELGLLVHTTGPFYQDDRRLHLEVETPGLIDSLHFVDDTEITSDLPEDFVELEVESCGINFRDVMVATGHLDLDELGTECSGVLTAVGSAVRQFKPGDKVFGFAANTYARSLRCPAAGLHSIPDGLSFSVAASLPVVYCTVMYALVDIANVRAGETVLIHVAAGGVGQAAIMLCQHLGAEILVTVGTLVKKNFLMETYGIAEQNMFFSRNASFAEQVMARTKGRGVDVILNSLAGEQLRHSWNCIAPFGRFLEIGKRDMALNTRLEMNPFFRNVIFASIDLILIRDQRIGILQRLLGETCKLLEEGCIKPVQPIHTVSFADIEGAFRKLQNGQEYGKFVAVPNELDMVKVCLFKRTSSKTNPIRFVLESQMPPRYAQTSLILS